VAACPPAARCKTVAVNLWGRSLRATDRIQARGVLLGGDSAPRLVSVAEVQPGRRQQLNECAVDVSGLDHQQLGFGGESVTIAGEWTGSLLQAQMVSLTTDGPPFAFRFPTSIGDRCDIDLPVVNKGLPPPDQARIADAVRSLTDEGRLLQYARVRSASGEVVVVSAVDVEPVEAILRPLLGDSLVVVPSPWSRRDLDAVQEILLQETDTAGIVMVGEGMDPQGHVQAVTWVRHVTPGLEEGLAALPQGILALEAWLVPQESSV
jgi:hypothetical protein